MRNKEYRHGLVNAQIEVDLPLQIRALRKQLVGTQPELCSLTGMKQPRISAMEKPGGAHFTLETLRRLAEAFDVALIVRFAPFSELLDWSERFNPDTFRIPSFTEEVEEKQIVSVRSVAPTTVGTLEALMGAASGATAPYAQRRQIHVYDALHHYQGGPYGRLLESKVMVGNQAGVASTVSTPSASSIKKPPTQEMAGNFPQIVSPSGGL